MVQILPVAKRGGWSIRRRHGSSFRGVLTPKTVLCLLAVVVTLSILLTGDDDDYSRPSNLKKVARPLPLSMKQFEAADDDDYDDECEWMHEWQQETYMNCNNLHDIDLTGSSLTFINCGSSRCAVSFIDHNGKKLILKVLKSSREFTESTYRKARRDSLAMERLTFSPYVSNIYAGCGVSHITEYGAGGTVHDLIKLSRQNNGEFLRPLTKLKIAYQLATAVADMHSFESDKVASLSHNDICCHQFVLIGGVYVLFL